MNKVVSFGEILLRLSAPGYTRLLQKDSFEATFCGGEANVAASLAVFGLPSVFVTKLPNNEVGVAAAHSLDYFRVDTSKIIYGEGRMGIYYLEKGASQRPSKVIYDRAYSAISMANSLEFDWDAIFKDAGWFHWTGINPALSDNLTDICEKACRKAKEKGITVSCDLNYRKTLWSREKAQSVMKRLMPYVDVCIANEEDADQVLGIRSEGTNVERGQLNLAGYEQVAQEICTRYGCHHVAITLRQSCSASRNGWRAVLYDSEKKKMYLSREYDIQIVDRVGGGDSFTAGIIYSFMTGKDNQMVIDFSTAASCLKHTIEGDYNRTTIEEVEALLKSGGNGRVIR